MDMMGEGRKPLGLLALIAVSAILVSAVIAVNADARGANANGKKGGGGTPAPTGTCSVTPSTEAHFNDSSWRHDNRGPLAAAPCVMLFRFRLFVCRRPPPYGSITIVQVYVPGFSVDTPSPNTSSVSSSGDAVPAVPAAVTFTGMLNVVGLSTVTGTEPSIDGVEFEPLMFTTAPVVSP